MLERVDSQRKDEREEVKICIWYETTDNPYGGANSFLKSLSNELKKIGHEVVNRPDSSVDILLMNSWTYGVGKRLSFRMVEKVKKYGGLSWRDIISGFLFANNKKNIESIIHRLDGVAALYGRKDDADTIQIKINRLTDYTIFQSEFCRQSFASLGVKPQKSVVIHNGVDSGLYYPDKAVKTLKRTMKALAVSWSNNPMKGFSQLVEIASCPDIELAFIGNWCNTIPQGNVKVLGTMAASEIAMIMKQCDILVHPAENDPCPNAVIEALASGLPILYKDSGGTAELSSGYGVAINTYNINSSLEEIRERFANIRENILANIQMFSIKHAAKQYVEVFKRKK